MLLPRPPLRARGGGATYPWEEGLLDVLLPQLCPSASTRSSRLTHLKQEIEDVPELLARLDAVLQTRDDAIARLTRLLGDL